MAIVVGYVPRPQGDAALRLAVTEARTRGEAVHLVNWGRREAPADAGYASEEDLAAARNLLERAGVEYSVFQAVGRDGAEGVLDRAAEIGASCIVIGLRRRTAAGKFFFGSNAQRILMEAPCPVLTVREDSLPAVEPDSGG